MGSPDVPEVEATPTPASKADASVAGELEKSLLKRRSGSSKSFLTKGQLGNEKKGL